MTIRFSIVDDHTLLAQSVALALQGRGHQARCPAVTTLPRILAELLRDPPDVVLLDLQLGKAGHARELIGPLRDSGIRVLVVSALTDDIEVAAVMEAGATGFVTKSRGLDELLESALAVAHGEPLMSDSERFTLLQKLRAKRGEEASARRPFERLSARECAVLHQLCRGESVTSIAQGSVVSVATVRSQVRAILTKLGVRSQLEAVALANTSGWFSESEQARPAV